jgi:hypothetical protein
MRRSSSRREKTKIAKGETLGERSDQRFPPHRGGAMCELSGDVPRQEIEHSIRPYGANSPLSALFPGFRCASPWAILDASLREVFGDTPP